jgi:hypothetical protein
MKWEHETAVALLFAIALALFAVAFAFLLFEALICHPSPITRREVAARGWDPVSAAAAAAGSPDADRSIGACSRAPNMTRQARASRFEPR